jgi:NAD(P)-dependent dehydrogenase (short-subunit alcohol dehydrogenase family)
MQRIFITGANRGLGLEIVRQYLERGDHVFAAARKFDAVGQYDGKYKGTLTKITLDVTNLDEITAAAQAVRQSTNGIDILINNAAINPREPAYRTLGSLDAQALEYEMRINAIAPLMIVQAFADLLKNGTNPKLINITSQQGSMQLKTGAGGGYAYSVSKAALNMATRLLAGDLASSGVVTMMIHPGWVQTDMGGGGAPLSAHESASSLLKIIDNLTSKDNGRFFNINGQDHMW